MESALAQEKLASDDEGDDQTQPAATSTSHLTASSVKDNGGNLPVQKDGEEVSDQMDDDFQDPCQALNHQRMMRNLMLSRLHMKRYVVLLIFPPQN